RTADIPVNQFKIADIIWRYRLSRLIVYYAAYLLDQGYQPLLDATTAKLFATESLMKISMDAIQCMGGDGWTKFYPVEEIFRSAKVMEIVAGTNEIMKLILYRQGIKLLSHDIRPPLRRMDENLKFPVPYFKVQPSIVKKPITQEDVLKILAENYVVNPGLYMTKEDIKMFISIADKELDKILLELEGKKLVKLFRGRRGEILMARATYDGLKKVYPLEHYKCIPDWVNPEDLR
nr:acyl-CoA dehydrogenase family protein [Candidatus Baldrarchaeota archaeon]